MGEVLGFVYAEQKGLPVAKKTGSEALRASSGPPTFLTQSPLMTGVNF